MASKTSHSEPAVCDRTEPPTCCQPAMSPEEWQRRGERIAAIEREIIARSPKQCPSCGSREVAPLFWPDASLDVWDCWEPGCRAIFSGRGD